MRRGRLTMTSRFDATALVLTGASLSFRNISGSALIEVAATDAYASGRIFSDQRRSGLLVFELPERFQRPLGGGSIAPEDVQIPIIRAYFEERIIRRIPLVANLLDQVLTLIKPKAGWAFIRFPAGVALHP